MKRQQPDLIELLFQSHRMVKNIVANRIEEITEARLPEFVTLSLERQTFVSAEEKEDSLAGLRGTLILANSLMCHCDEPLGIMLLRRIVSHTLERYRIEMNMPHERFYEGTRS